MQVFEKYQILPMPMVSPQKWKTSKKISDYLCSYLLIFFDIIY